MSSVWARAPSSSCLTTTTFARITYSSELTARSYHQSCHRHFTPLPSAEKSVRAKIRQEPRRAIGGRATDEATRHLHVTPARQQPPAAPKSRDRGPKSEEDTQTDFTAMNVLGSMPPPSTAVDACMDNGFALDSGLKVSGSGVILLGGEAFKWRPWVREGQKEGTIGAGGVGDDNKGVQSMGGKLQNRKGQWDVDASAWGILDLAWPKPDLLVLGTGLKMLPISPETRRHINELGIRIEIQDTRNAAAQFNLLATERGVQQVAAALIPVGWREGK